METAPFGQLITASGGKNKKGKTKNKRKISEG
jgi:hypothetical protein